MIGKQNKDWLKNPWIWLGLIVIALVSILLFLYWYHMGDSGFSDKNQDWAAFGSYLSGIFTMFAAIGTVGTLFILIRQQKEQQDALTFDRCQSHYSLFCEKLKSIETLCGNSFSFNNPMKLYGDIFPDNNPTGFSSAKGNEKKLNDLLFAYEQLYKCLDESNDLREIDSFLYSIVKMNAYLSISFLGDPADGDYCYEGRRIGLNRHKPRIYHHYLIISELLRFSGVDGKIYMYNFDPRAAEKLNNRAKNMDFPCDNPFTCTDQLANCLKKTGKSYRRSSTAPYNRKFL